MNDLNIDIFEYYDKRLEKYIYFAESVGGDFAIINRLFEKPINQFPSDLKEDEVFYLYIGEMEIKRSKKVQFKRGDCVIGTKHSKYKHRPIGESEFQIFETETNSFRGVRAQDCLSEIEELSVFDLKHHVVPWIAYSNGISNDRPVHSIVHFKDT